MEQNAVTTTMIKSLGVSAATVALALFAYGASAQTAAKKDAAPKPKAPPACNSLKAQAGCEARTDCEWIAAMVNAKTKKQTRAAYCRSKPKAPAAKTPAAKDTKKK